MRQREFIAGLGSGAVAWPLAVRAQQSTIPEIGFLNADSPQGYARQLSAFLKALGENGYVDGRNVAIEYRFAENQYDRLPALAAGLVRRQVAVIVSTGGVQGALAAKAAAVRRVCAETSERPGPRTRIACIFPHYRGTRPQRLMGATEIVAHREQRHGMCLVLDLLAGCAGQPASPSGFGKSVIS